VSVIIVTYNSADVIQNCLFSLAHGLKHLSAEIIIIDNDSLDSTIKIVKSVQQKSINKNIAFQIIQNKKNYGFTYATNQGIRQSKGRYILLMNPDVEVAELTISCLLDFSNKNSKVGIVAPQLRFPTGQIQPSCRRFPKCRDLFFEFSGISKVFPQSGFLNRWRMADFNHQTVKDVDQPQGAFLLVRRQAVEKVGLLDEHFEMFFSDVDWCRRFGESGWRIVFLPDTFAIHHKGTSIYANRVQMIITSHRDFIQYYLKYANDLLLPNWFIKFLFLLSAWPRILTEIIKQQLNQLKTEKILL